MDYVLIATILLYVFVVQVTVKFALKITTSALLAVLFPFLLTAIIKGILLSRYGLEFSQVFSLENVVLLIVQLAVAIGIFYKLEQHEDATGTWFGWAIAGGVILFLIIPYLLKMVPSIF